MRAEIVVVRHCQSTWNLERRCQGDTPHPDLTDLGRQQAHASAELLVDTPYDHIYSSNTNRTMQTADIIQQRLSLSPMKIEPRLREMVQGEWQGMLYEDIKKEYGDIYDSFIKNPLDPKALPPGGESIIELTQRTIEAVNDIGNAHPGERVLVVSHEIPIAALRCMVLGQPLSRVFEHAPKNGESVTLPWPPVQPMAQFAARFDINVYQATG